MSSNLFRLGGVAIKKPLCPKLTIVKDALEIGDHTRSEVSQQIDYIASLLNASKQALLPLPLEPATIRTHDEQYLDLMPE